MCIRIMDLITPFIFVASFCAKGTSFSGTVRLGPPIGRLWRTFWLVKPKWDLRGCYGFHGESSALSSNVFKSLAQRCRAVILHLGRNHFTGDLKLSCQFMMIKDHLCFNKYAPLEFLSDVSDNSSRQHYIMRCARPLATWQIWSCEYTKAYTRFFPLVAILISMSLATWWCWLAGGHFFASFLTLKEFRFLDSKEADQEQLRVLVEMTETTHHLVLKGNHHS